MQIEVELLATKMILQFPQGDVYEIPLKRMIALDLGVNEEDVTDDALQDRIDLYYADPGYLSEMIMNEVEWSDVEDVAVHRGNSCADKSMAELFKEAVFYLE